LGWRAYSPSFKNARNADTVHDYQLQYVIKGSGHIIWDETRYELCAGDLFFIDLRQQHRYVASENDPWEAIWVHFGGTHAKMYYDMLDNKCPVYRLEPTNIEPYFYKLAQLYKELPAGFELSACATLNMILTEIVISDSQTPFAHTSAATRMNYMEAINKAVVYMKHSLQAPLTLELIAAQANLSPFYFSRLFKRTTGFSVKEFLNKQRLTKAKYLLANTRLSVTEISGRAGFADPGHFATVFKRYEKLTPTQFRNNTW
jgi:AraC-like DNA-binding protein